MNDCIKSTDILDVVYFLFKLHTTLPENDFFTICVACSEGVSASTIYTEGDWHPACLQRQWRDTLHPEDVIVTVDSNAFTRNNS